MEPISRQSVRALIFDDQKRVLLVREPVLHRPELELWVTPGGGIEPLEEATAALRRELEEEIGIADFSLGPHVWDRRDVYAFKERMYDQCEQFYLVDIQEALPSTGDREWRWWSVEEIRRDQGRILFAPRTLAVLLPPLLAGQIPADPIDVGK